mgnify:CR=1 FL=1
MSLLAIILIIVALLLGAGIGIFAGISYRNNVAEKEIGSAEEEARKIVSEAMKTAEAKKKEVVLEGKDEVHRFRTESEKEIADRRKEVQRQERRIQQKEETLDKKLDNMELKDEKLSRKLKDADANGAYNIARKGLIVIENILNDIKEPMKISNEDYLKYMQK